MTYQNTHPFLVAPNHHCFFLFLFLFHMVSDIRCLHNCKTNSYLKWVKPVKFDSYSKKFDPYNYLPTITNVKIKIKFGFGLGHTYKAGLFFEESLTKNFDTIDTLYQKNNQYQKRNFILLYLCNMMLDSTFATIPNYGVN